MKCFCTTWAYQAVKIIALRLKNLPWVSKITETGRNMTVPCLTTFHSSWMVRWLRPHGVRCTVWGYYKNETPDHLVYLCMLRCMNKICTGSVQQLYFRMICHLCPPWNFFPRHKPHSITKAEGSAVNSNTTAQQNTVGQKLRSKTTNQSSPKGVLIYQRSEKSSTIS